MSPSNHDYEEHVSRGVDAITEEDLKKALKKQGKAVEIASKVSVLRPFLAKLSLLGHMLKDYWDEKYAELPWRTVASVTFAILYVVNPLDLIPDFLPGVGYLDDAAVFGLVWRGIEGDVEQYAVWKLAQRDTTDDVRVLVQSAFPHLTQPQ